MRNTVQAGFDSDGKAIYYKNCVDCDEEFSFRNFQMAAYLELCPNCGQKRAQNSDSTAPQAARN